MSNQTKSIFTAIICLIFMSIFWFVYEEWGRLFVDDIAYKFIGSAACDKQFDAIKCMEIAQNYENIQNIGYFSYAIILNFLAAFSISKLLLKNFEGNIKDFVIYTSAYMSVPFIAFLIAGYSDVATILLHFFALVGGIILGSFNNKKLT